MLYGDENEHLKAFQNLESTEFEPGTHYERQDPAYILVAPLIERITGTKFNIWMSENIFKPAGIHEMFFHSCDTEMPQTAHAYRKVCDTKHSNHNSKSEKWEEYDLGEAPFFTTRADRGAYGSARDFMKWTRALYSGKIISDSSLQAMNTSYIPTDIPMVSFGLGTAVRNESGFPAKSYHMNNNGGFSIIEGTWPEKHLHYIIFANRADWNNRAVMASIDSIFLANHFTH